MRFVPILIIDAAMPPVCKLRSASDVGRACAAQCHPAHVAAGMRACAVRPSGSVWLATPRRGRSPLPGRRFVPASDVAHARTHWRAACKWGGAASSLPLCPRAASSFPGRRRHFWRQTGGRRVYDRTQTVTAACNPLGDTPIVSHSRKEGTVAVPTHASDVGWFP